MGSSRPLANILNVAGQQNRAAVADVVVVLVVLVLVLMVAVIVGFSIVAVGIFSRWFRCMSWGAAVNVSPVVVAPLAVSGVVVIVLETGLVPVVSQSPSTQSMSMSFEGNAAHRRPMSRLI